jgi:hypothetical protein
MDALRKVRRAQADTGKGAPAPAAQALQMTNGLGNRAQSGLITLVKRSDSARPHGMPKLKPLPLVILASALLVTACASSRRNPELAYVERPVEQLYNQATDRLDRRDYERAKLFFEEVERQHP